MWDISRIGQYGILLLGISSEASRRRGMEKVNSFREPVGAAGFCAIWQRNGEAGIRKKQHNCKLTFLVIKEVKICQTIHRGLMIVSASIAITFLMVSRLATQIWTLVSWSVQSVAGKWA